jgi:hypothetical protein
MSETEVIAKKFKILEPSLDDRQRRIWAATEAMAMGQGDHSGVRGDRRQDLEGPNEGAPDLARRVP